MAELLAIYLRPGPEFLDTVRRAWDRGDAVLVVPQEAPQQFRIDLALGLGAGTWVDASGTHSTEGGWPVEPGDALVVATSGTTGEPKGVVHTHQSIEASAFSTATALGVGPTHWLCCLPLSHVAGMSVITRSWLTGAELTVHDGFDAAAVDRTATAGATHVSLVPTALRRIDTTLWQRILLGGSSIPADRPANTVAGYGMTETYGGIVYEGQALPGVSVRIAGASGNTGESGPIEVRTPTAMSGYRRRPRSGDEAILDPSAIDSSGWLRTGDLGRIHPIDGRLQVEGRADDLINTGGEKVWPTPVEQLLETHPGVSEAAVIGVPDAEWGRRVKAVIVPAEGAAPPTLQAMRDWVSASLPKAAAPREVELVSQLPRTSLGKLRRSSLYHTGGDGDSGGGERGN
ncbi:MAG: class I adenylate-forming enzyme family protein [Microthrixaceae bacterium]